MRLSLTPFIALLASALSFLFAYMTEGIGFLPTLFNLAGLAMLAWVALIALHALYRLVQSHNPSQKPANGVKSPNEPGI